MDFSAKVLHRPSTSPRPMLPISARASAFEEDALLESRIQNLLENWMKHFDQRFQDLANIQKHHALTPYQNVGYDRGQSQIRKEFQSSADVGVGSIKFLQPEHHPDDEFSEQRFSDMSLQPQGKKKQSLGYEKALARCSTLQARKTIQNKMLNLHEQMSQSKSKTTSTGLRSVFQHPHFENVIALAIIINGIIIGVQVEMTARSGPGDHAVFAIAEAIFFAIFVIELFLRIYGLRSQWVHSLWNIFDAAIVMLQLSEFVLKACGGSMSSQGSATGRVLRVVRLIRVVRMLRLLRFFLQLRVMAKMIMFSLDSLFWLMILLVVMIYIVSVVFTQGFSDYAISDSVDLDRAASLENFFGDLPRSTWTLFQSITNGMEWGGVAEDVYEIHAFFFIIFVCFMFFVFFSVLNVVTGVFVDGAIQHAGQEREVLVAAERASLEEICSKLTELLMDMDVDRNGYISLDELIASAKDPNLASYFSALEIHTPETADLFAFLDRDGDGQINIQEFIEGCLRIRGGARNIDLHMLMFRMETEQRGLLQHVADTFESVKKSIASIHAHLSQVQTHVESTIPDSSILLSSLALRQSSGPRPTYQPQTPRKVEANEEIPFDAHMGKCIPRSPRSHITQQHK